MSFRRRPRVEKVNIIIDLLVGNAEFTENSIIRAGWVNDLYHKFHFVN